MEIHPLLLQFGASLIAIFALFGLAKALKLGPKPRLDNELTVHRAASEVQDGFEAQKIAISRNRDAALVRDGSGQIMLIKCHGNRFAGRILDSAANVREEVDAIIVDPGESQFGIVKLSIEEPGIWVDTINRL